MNYYECEYCGRDISANFRARLCDGCGLDWIISSKTKIPKSGYICPHCESRLRAGEKLKTRQGRRTINEDCYHTAF